MTVWWCRGCGMEDTRPHNACPSCGSALQSSSVEWLEEGELGAETVYELDTDPNERSAIVEALHEERIRHRWEGVTDLVVAESDEEAVDRIVDEVLDEELEYVDSAGGGAVDDVGGVDDAGSDGYEALSRLFIATDTLLRAWQDENVIAFISEAGGALVTPVPFGVEEEAWAEIQAHARNAATALEIDKDAEVEPILKDLHALLRELV